MNSDLKSVGLTLACIFLSNHAPAADDNANGLSDVWEQRYKASSLVSSHDDDGDSYSNFQESIAGTDPLDNSDKPNMLNTFFQNEDDEFQLSFKTLSGKYYHIFESENLGEFNQIGNGWWGDGEHRELNLTVGGESQTPSPVRSEFWADIQADSITNLTSDPDFPLNPDGVTYNAAPEAPLFIATGYGARLTMWISPAVSGDYVFYLSAGASAELFLDDSPGGTTASKRAEILPTQTGLTAEEWETYSTQTSASISLLAGEPYLLELYYLAQNPLQHAQIAWSGPGTDGIVKLDRDDLAPVHFLANYKSERSLFKHDYDSAGETDLLWPVTASGGFETGLPGMTGNAERILSDPGSNSQERKTLTANTTEPITSLYATWLFNMAPGHGDISFIFLEGTDASKEGPRISMEQEGAGAEVRTFNGDTIARIDVSHDQTYRVEIVATLDAAGIEYDTPSGTKTAASNTFDLYVSSTEGQLVGSATNLIFRDSNEITSLSTLHAAFSTNPNIAIDDIEITDGQIAGNGYLIPSNTEFDTETDSSFFTLSVENQDQDNDGIPDWEELALAEFHPFLFFDSETTNGTNDALALSSILSSSQGKPEIALFGTDAAAFESNYPNTIPDNGQFTITRSGTLEPLSVKICVPPLVASGSFTTVCDGSCCMLIGSAGDEEAEPSDYILTDEDGTIITDTVNFDFGEITKIVTLTAVNDEINEYPETLNIAIQVPTDDSYNLSATQNGSSIQIFDLPDSADNLTIFTGVFDPENEAATSASGTAVLSINGPRTEIRIWSDFSGLTSDQSNAHIHKANTGITSGNVVYPITTIPGDSSSGPLHGRLEYYPAVVLHDESVPDGISKGEGYPWDLTQANAVVSSVSGTTASKQVIIDSLFNQNGETPLYLNIHSTNYMAGEIWALLGVSGGSITDPGGATAPASPGTTEYPVLANSLLETEVRRFLNQATFGAKEDQVQALLTKIETEKLGDPNYHRNEAFSEWIDDQMDTSTYNQTYLLDYTLATFFNRVTLAGIYDSTLNPGDETTPTPVKPSTWPSIDRSAANPEHWYLSDEFPLTRNELSVSSSVGVNTSTGREERRHAHWQVMLNASDQLRQKMGYALQQIVVVSATESVLSNSILATTNYQDMLNTYAFSHYRDVLGYVNWSPVMGRWLSSIQNQKSVDFDGDGLYDSYPDENLARENMQLFSIGLFEMWSDGTLKLTAEGLPRSTYTNDDIQEFAKIITGQTFSQYESTTALPSWGGVPYVASNTNFFASTGTSGLNARSYHYPMKMFGEYHSTGTKTFAGIEIDNTHLTDPTEQGEADIEAALDWLAGKPGDGLPDFDMVNSHVSTPAFISLRLIQRFTTSNPSQEYLHRVATTFKDSEGDLGLTLKAILLDPEARNIDLDDKVFGMKKSPVEAYIQLLRSLGGHTYIPLKNEGGISPYSGALGDYSNPEIYIENFGYPQEQLDGFEDNVRFLPSTTYTSGSSGLQMNPFEQDTVFNYYRPSYSPGGVINEAGLVAPEMQLLNEPDVVRNINYFEDITRSAVGPSANEIGGTNETQILAFNETDAALHDYPRIDRQELADTFFPAVEPTTGMTNGATGDTESISGSSAATPHWVRLSRVGDTFTSSESTDGLSWTVVTTWDLPLADEIYIGLATTSHDDGTLTTAVFDDISITGGNSVWQSADIGSVSATGSSSLSGNGEYLVQASGSDIWGTNDEFHYVYQMLDGDGEITAQVKSLTVTNQWAKAGVMIREKLAANSANVATLVSGSRGVISQRRVTLTGRSNESIADEAMFDELDARLTNGLLKLIYPYDASDNDDPDTPGVDDLLKNPREIIIDAVTDSYGSVYDGSNDENDRLNKFSDALYLLTLSPDYQIKQ
ncbi:MAG: DUF1800 family protein [Akkermansiaceae bacterium]